MHFCIWHLDLVRSYEAKNIGVRRLVGSTDQAFQVASTSELLENQRNDLVFFKIIPSHFCRASEASKIVASKIKYEKFGPRILVPH